MNAYEHGLMVAEVTDVMVILNVGNISTEDEINTGVLPGRGNLGVVQEKKTELVFHEAKKNLILIPVSDVPIEVAVENDRLMRIFLEKF